MQKNLHKSTGAIVIEKIKTPEFWKSWDKMKDVSEDISDKDIIRVIKWTRKSPF